MDIIQNWLLELLFLSIDFSLLVELMEPQHIIMILKSQTRVEKKSKAIKTKSLNLESIGCLVKWEKF